MEFDVRTTITLKDDLLKLVQSRARHQCIAKAVNHALEDWARRLRVEKLKSFSGTVPFDHNWKQLRRLK
jgi:phage baseplate assembly protein W